MKDEKQKLQNIQKPVVDAAKKSIEASKAPEKDSKVPVSSTTKPSTPVEVKNSNVAKSPITNNVKPTDASKNTEKKEEKANPAVKTPSKEEVKDGAKKVIEDVKADVKNPAKDIKDSVKPVESSLKTPEKVEANSAIKPGVTPGVKPIEKSEKAPEKKPEEKSAINSEVKPGIKPEVKADVKPEMNSSKNLVHSETELADAVETFKHGLTDAQIKEMPFAEILKVILKDTNVTDVSFNGKSVYIQHNMKGRYKFSDVVPSSEIENFVKDIANKSNEKFNVENPIIDYEIMDLYTERKNAILRLNAVHESISPYGTTAAIRITQSELRLTENDRVFAPLEIFKLIEAMVRGNLNILISGRTGSGKTELQKFLVNYIRDAETIVLIEDTKDTNLKDLYPYKNISSWVTNSGIKNPIDFDALIRASLRNNPDWIIVSETRGSEAYQMIKSGLSGHKIITTLHSDSADSNIDRLIHMCKEKYDLDQMLLGKMITNVFDIGIHIDYDITKEGTKRYVCEIVEYKDYNDRGVIVNPIYSLKFQPVKQADGSVRYERVNQIGKISKTLFDKLARKQVLTKEIEKFIEEGYYGKEK